MRSQTTMIKLTNIKKSDTFIYCTALVEDCKETFELSYDIENDNFEKFVLPTGYEWCKTHIAQAKRFLKSISPKEDYPSEKLIMWY